MRTTEFKNRLMPVSGMLSIRKLIRLSGARLIFPFYHTISDRSLPHVKNLYKVKSKAEFINDLDFLLKHFEAISPSFLQHEYCLRLLRTPSFILSFDDGLREIHDVLLPILEQKGVPAIFFLNNQFIDNKDLFYRYKASLIVEKLKTQPLSKKRLKEISSRLKSKSVDPEEIAELVLSIGYGNRKLLDSVANILEIDFREYLKNERPYLNHDEVESILSKGFYIGAHGSDHRMLNELSEEEQLKEIRESISDIVTRFQLNYSFFAFPFNDVGIDEGIFSKLFNSEPRIDASFGTSGLRKFNEYPHFQRIDLEKSNSHAGKFIKTEYVYYLLKSLAGK